MVQAETYMEIAREAMRLGNKIKQIRGLPNLPTFVTGLAGEYYVTALLLRKKLTLRPKGGQAGYDLELQGRKKLEVRTSTLKDEGVFSKEKKIRNYGWRLKDEGKDVKFDYVICVALDTRNVEHSKCYVFRRNEIDKAPKIDVGRFKKVEKRLWIFPTLQMMEKAKKDQPRLVSEWTEKINKNLDKYLLEQRWHLFQS